ncbi:hypothetical protein EDM80_06420 [bacterium]|nr:MAG: hypothetical protein EDM80_06420 [bacterium]RIK62710.1 MAG: hypothetical protein DCC64_09125 [Planctomycetota bacterium]
MFRPALVGKLEGLRALDLGGQAHGCLSTGVAALDEHLGGGLPCGAVTEIFGETGGGAWWLGLCVLAQVQGKINAVIEPAGSFFPPGAASLGVDLSRLLVVRESNRRKALWALERVAREKQVGATLAAMGNLTDTEARRLQLAAESSGQALILLRSPPELSRASWGALRLRVRSEPGPGRCIVVEVLRVRGARILRPMLLELDHDTMAVRTSALLPHRTDHAGRSQSAG